MSVASMSAEQLEFPVRRRLPRRRARGRRAVKEEQMQLPVRGPFDVPPGDFPRPGLVDAAFVERSAEAIRQKPNVLALLRRFLADKLESIDAIDRLYRGKLNEWAASTRQRLWMEYFTAEAVLKRLTPTPGRASGAEGRGALLGVPG